MPSSLEQDDKAADVHTLCAFIEDLESDHAIDEHAAIHLKDMAVNGDPRIFAAVDVGEAKLPLVLVCCVASPVAHTTPVVNASAVHPCRCGCCLLGVHWRR